MYIKFRFTQRFYAIWVVLTAGFAMSFFFSWLWMFMLLCVGVLTGFCLLDGLILFRMREGLGAVRSVPEKLSNGDENPIYIEIINQYPFKIKLEVIDELPFQFQIRNFSLQHNLLAGATKKIYYLLRPTRRGEYHFGHIRCFVTSPFGLVQRHFKLGYPQTVKVYPSFLQMRRYEILAISHRLTETGIKKIRRLGHTREFEQIKTYVSGDDMRNINWKATARRGDLMVNEYLDEKSQAIYCLIDKGRAMKMPFDGMSLLDYAVNASLVLCNIALLKQDRAGLATFSHKLGTLLLAQRSSKQMGVILEHLYNQKTAFKDTNFEPLVTYIHRKINQRSLLVLFTNFESLASMERQLPYLKLLAKAHVLLVIFFENTVLNALTQPTPQDTQQVFEQVIIEKFAYEKRLIIKALMQNGIYSVLTTPQQLTVDTLNKYLEMKARGLI